MTTRKKPQAKKTSVKKTRPPEWSERTTAERFAVFDRVNDALLELANGLSGPRPQGWTKITLIIDRPRGRPTFITTFPRPKPRKRT